MPRHSQFQPNTALGADVVKGRPKRSTVFNLLRHKKRRLFYAVGHNPSGSESSKRRNVNGSPYSLFRFPSDFRTRSFAPSNAARISFVVVFPTEPVTPAIFPPQAWRTALANCLSASKVSTTAMQRLPISPANRENWLSATTAAIAPLPSAL